MIILSKIWKNRKVFRSILPTIYFNFHYLPFNQAIKLPILLYKPKFYDLKGTVEINAKGGGKKKLQIEIWHDKTRFPHGIYVS